MEVSPHSQLYIAVHVLALSTVYPLVYMFKCGLANPRLKAQYCVSKHVICTGTMSTNSNYRHLCSYLFKSFACGSKMGFKMSDLCTDAILRSENSIKQPLPIHLFCEITANSWGINL